MMTRWRVAVLIVLCAGAALQAAGDVIVTPIARDGQVQVSFDLSDGFTPDVRDAIRSGLTTTFSYTVQLRRSAAAWFDVTVAEVVVRATVRYDNLTRQFDLSRSLNGRTEAGPSSGDEDAARLWMTHFERVPVSATAALEANGEYYVRVRAQTRTRNTWFFWPWDGDSALGHAKFTFIP